MTSKNGLSIIKPVPKTRIGLYSAGLKAYWSQFEGLRDRLRQYGAFIEEKLSQYGEVFNYGLVDDEAEGRKAGEWLNANNVDIVFCHSATYFTSASALPVHQACKAHVVILNLQPTAAMNYARTTTGEWLAHCGACPVPEFCNALGRAGISFDVVNGLLGLEKTPEISVADEVTAHRPEAVKVWEKASRFARAAGVKRMLRGARFGFLGGNYSGMLDMYSDFTVLQTQTGMHVELLEMCDLNRSLQKITDAEVSEKMDAIGKFFRIEGDSPADPIAKKPDPEQLRWSARVAAAQERMAREYDLDALAYYYHGSDDNEYERLQAGFIVGHSLLTAAGVPCAGEGDMKTALAMKICDSLGVGGSFSEIVAVDYNIGSIILGHDGPFHIMISDGKPVLRGMGVYHGKRGSGVSVEANVAAGDVTLLGAAQTSEGKLRFIVSEGKAVKEEILKIGNTQTHVIFDTDPDTYMDKWFPCEPTHHMAMSVGRNAELFLTTAKLLGIECLIV
ncbi:MAG: L-fucose/L-arabinose isomerase family protein [Clostridiales Family XIII bacterium]|jgi:L-arabinose isomerase|nr:L-fucose/L-arabinose isomerase family protein [Clostridiales Family XIII bacterium]